MIFILCHPQTFTQEKILFMLEISISYFHTSLYIPEKQISAFHLPHVRIIVTHHCGNTRREEIKYPCSFQDVLGWCDYSERVVASFAHQIQSE